MSDKSVTLAAITGAHGVTGEVRLKLFGEGVESLKGFRAFGISGKDETLTPKKVRDDGKGGAIARFAEVGDRNAAESLRGSLLTVPRDALPALEEGEYYHADLLGLSAMAEDGRTLGTVIAVENYGAGDVIEIERPEGSKPRIFMVPMHADAVSAWDETTLTVTANFAEP
ncbi:ribosome maturation factor RimM [Croceicoccus sediminis]|uniref:ribosome maturation factor RimM n=1 Tax=Croceicoccus sediminis TaxID=2571150 RepID=UPI001182F078|nr:ribosome maturation factor RimM [Croceicoccus sediminis]